LLQSSGGAAETDLRLAILNVPGIQDVVFERQAGTYTAFIYGISPAVPPSLLQMVQAQINATTAWPLTGTAVSPDLIGISFATTLTFVAGATPSEQQTAIANATTAAQNYINNLATGQEFVNQSAGRADAQHQVPPRRVHIKLRAPGREASQKLSWITSGALRAVAVPIRFSFLLGASSMMRDSARHLSPPRRTNTKVVDV